MFSKYKTIFQIVGAVCILFLIWVTFFRSGTGEESLSGIQAVEDDLTELEISVINRLDSVAQIQIDKSVFDDEIFKSLIPPKVEIKNNEPLKKGNPFGPIPLNIFEILNVGGNNSVVIPPVATTSASTSVIKTSTTTNTSTTTK
jgi:hypothetical protein